MTVIIGLTGPTGSGKSTASRIASQIGINVIDCDALARIAVEKGTDGLKAVCDAFGNEILDSDGSLCRKALAKAAFSSRENTELLNKTLLPHIARLVEDNILKDKTNILDAPTLFESGINKICDTTLAVLASPEIRLLRIMKRDGISEHDARLRMSAGKPDEFYKQKADIIVYNNDDSKIFKSEITTVLNNIAGGM